MKNWKRIAATVLAASMMMSSTMSIAYADTSVQNGWVYNEDDGVWNLYRNGKMKVSSLAIESNAVYYLGADGEMAAGEILDLYHKADDDGSLGNVFEVYYDDETPKYLNKKGEEVVVPEDKRENITTVYAKPSGRLAKENWIILDGGDVAYNEDSDSAAWYYFGDKENTENVWGNGANGTNIFNAYQYEMVVDKGFKQGGYKYRMDSNGEMIRASWYTGGENESIPEEDYKYYSYFGNMVQGHDDEKKEYEFRYLDDKWFAFKEDGTPMNVYFTDESEGVIEENGELTAFDNIEISINSTGNRMKRLATVNDVVYSGSNAELEYEIVDEDTWAKIKAGEAADQWMSVIFEVDLATPANASVAPQLSAKFHDVYLERDFSDNDNPGMLTGSVKAKLGRIDQDNNTIEVRFAAGSTGVTNLKLYVDGKADWVTIYSVLPEDEEAAVEGAKTIIGNALGSAGSGLEEANVNGLKALVDENEIVADTLLENIVSYSDDVASLEGSYSMVMGITSINETTEEAAELLGGTVSTVGLALNMEDEGVAAFNVTVEEDTKGLESEFENTAAFDYSVTLGGDETAEFDVPFVITTPVPEGMDADEVQIYHSHDGAEPKLIENVTVNEDGTVSFAVNQLSTFIFAQGILNNDNNSGNNDDTPSVQPDYDYDYDNDDDEPAYTKEYLEAKKAAEKAAEEKVETTPGQWIQNATGWWFQFEDGKYPANEWRRLAYNGSTAWYRFNAEGYMATGWFTAADGNVYYLNPISNGSQGAMLTGWQFIDGFWYYFNPVDDAIQGAMYRNTTTPDGYQVDADGRWIQ